MSSGIPRSRASDSSPLDRRNEAPLGALPLVGRDPELQLLRHALAQASGGCGCTLILAGESGVGKTRLTEAAREHADSLGFLTCVGHAFPVELALPYAAWADALQPVVRTLDAAQLAVLTRGGSTELAQILPALAPAAGVPRGTDGNPAERKAKLMYTVSQFLGRLAERRPLLIVLENLQWADSASIELLHFVARQARDFRFLLLCTYNEAEREGNDALRAAEQSLLAVGAARIHRLGALSLDAVHELLRDAFELPAAESQVFAEQLYSWTRGNPFFVDQTLKSLIESGQVRRQEGVWQGWSAGMLSVPPTVKEMLGERLRRISRPARALLDLTALVSTRMRHSLLRRASALDDEALFAALDELRQSHMLTESDEQGDIVYDIAHPMLRRTIVDQIGLARSRVLHRTLAEALEQEYAGRTMAHADELAYHYLRSGAGELAARTIDYLVAAGRSALGKSANREAAMYLRSALELLDEGRESGERARGQVVEDLAQALQRDGDYDAALVLWERALAEAQQRGELVRVAEIERRLGLVLYWWGRRDEALTHYQAGLGAARQAGSDELTCRLLLTRGACFLDIGDPEQAERDTARALSLAEASGDRQLLARAHRALLLLTVTSGRAEEAREHGTRTLQYATEIGSPAIAWSAHWALALLGGLTGDFASTWRHQQEAERLAEELQSPALRVRTAEMTVGFGYATGEWDRALSTGENALQVARALGYRGLLARLLVWLGFIRLGRDELELARAHIDEAWELSGAGRPMTRHTDVHAVILAHMGRAYSHLTRAEYDSALAVARAGLELADARGYTIWAIYRLLPIMIESLLWMARHDEAEHYWKRLRRDSERIGHRLGVVWADAGHALVDTLRGTTRPALLRVEASADSLEAVPYIFDSAKLRREIARRWVELGERDLALRSLARAHDVFVRLGAAGELRGCREQMRQLGVRPPAATSGTGRAGLSARELEIIRLVAARKSNKEAGQALGISARTVSTHLSNIFGKTGVSSRGELADYARAEGLLDD